MQSLLFIARGVRAEKGKEQARGALLVYHLRERVGPGRPQGDGRRSTPFSTRWRAWPARQLQCVEGELVPCVVTVSFGQ